MEKYVRGSIVGSSSASKMESSVAHLRTYVQRAGSRFLRQSKVDAYKYRTKTHKVKPVEHSGGRAQRKTQAQSSKKKIARKRVPKPLPTSLSPRPQQQPVGDRFRYTRSPCQREPKTSPVQPRRLPDVTFWPEEKEGI